MAATTAPPVAGLLTYEQYRAEGYIEGRYEILDGVRHFMPGANWRHQRIAGNAEEILRDFERTLLPCSPCKGGLLCLLRADK